MPSSNFINATDARRDFFDLLKKVKKSKYPFAIVYKGKPEVVLIGWDKYLKFKHELKKKNLLPENWP